MSKEQETRYKRLHKSNYDLIIECEKLEKENEILKKITNKMEELVEVSVDLSDTSVRYGWCEAEGWGCDKYLTEEKKLTKKRNKLRKEIKTLKDGIDED